MITTFPPKECGIAQFAENLVNAFFSLHYHNCTLDIFALSNEGETFRYANSRVIYGLKMDRQLPSRAFWDAALCINANSYSNVIIQQEFGISPVQWQILDLARWISPGIQLTTIVHTPRAYPNLEERDLIRQLGEFSQHMVFMSWYGYHSAVFTYGIQKTKCFFIPHGVTVDRRSTSFIFDFSKEFQSLSTGTKEESFSALLAKLDGKYVIASNGLIHMHKGYRRIVDALPFLVAEIPDVVFLIVGKEHQHNTEKNLMENLLNHAKTLGVGNSVIWYNSYLEYSKLRLLLKKTDVYVTPYDEITPTSGALLMAMAEGLAILSTPFRYAVEVLANNRGLFMPFSDTQITAMQLIKVLTDPDLKSSLGKAALSFVEKWSWENVAAQYLSLVTIGKTTPLSLDPFESFSNAKHSNLPDASWTKPQVKLFNKRLLTCPVDLDVVRNGTFALFVDHEVQLNAKFTDGKLTAIGFRNPFESFIMQRNNQEIFFNPTSEVEPSSTFQILSFDCSHVDLITPRLNVSLKAAQDSIDVQFFGSNRFAYPGGLIGDSLRCQWDQSYSCPFTSMFDLKWELWKIPDGDLLGINSSGQQWAFCSIHTNILKLPENQIASGQHDFYYDRYVPPNRIPWTVDFIYDGTTCSCELMDIWNHLNFLIKKRPVKLGNQMHQGILRLVQNNSTAEENDEACPEIVAKYFKDELKLQRKNLIYYGTRAYVSFASSNSKASEPNNFSILEKFSFEIPDVAPRTLFGAVPERRIAWLKRTIFSLPPTTNICFLLETCNVNVEDVMTFMSDFVNSFTSFDPLRLFVLIKSSELSLIQELNALLELDVFEPSTNIGIPVTSIKKPNIPNIVIYVSTSNSKRYRYKIMSQANVIIQPFSENSWISCRDAVEQALLGIPSVIPKAFLALPIYHEDASFVCESKAGIMSLLKTICENGQNGVKARSDRLVDRAKEHTAESIAQLLFEGHILPQATN